MSLRRFFIDNELDAPNVGSWARRVAAGLEKTSGRGSWARRAVEDINEESDLGPGSWTTKLKSAIRQELLSGGAPAPESYADLLASLGAARYWDLSEPSGNFLPVIGTDEFTVGSSLARWAQDGPFGIDHTMTITGGLHTVPKAELGTTEHTWALWVYGGGGTGWRAIVGGGGAWRYWYLVGQRLRPYGFSWNSAQGPVLSENRWYLIVVGSNADGVTYWVDGAVAHTHATPVATTTDATVARWGTNGGGSEALGQRMAHPTTWDRKLSDAEVLQLWQYEPPPPPVPDEKPAYFQTDQNIGPAVALTDQPGYFQTDHNIGPAVALTDQPGYFQTDQNIQE